jgi:hypothetical protein
MSDVELKQQEEQPDLTQEQVEIHEDPSQSKYNDEKGPSMTKEVKTGYHEMLKRTALLTLDNYKSWSTQMKGILELYGDWEIVESAETEDDSDNDEISFKQSVGSSSVSIQAKKKNAEQERRARTIWLMLHTTIKDRELLSAVNHLPRNKPGTLWRTLKETCGGDSKAQIQRWYKQFWQLRRNYGESVLSFNVRFQNVVSDLSEAGARVAKDEVISRYLEALGNEFQVLSDIVLLSDDHVNLRKVQALAREHELRHQRRDTVRRGGVSEQETGGSASLADNQVKRKITCFRCKKEGHMIKDCPKPGQKKNELKKCDHCGKPGHTKDDCHGLLKEKLKEAEAALKAVKMKSSAEYIARGKKAVILDSGASHHFNPQADRVSRVTNSEPLEVTVANGETIEVAKQGDFVLKGAKGTVHVGKAYVDLNMCRTLVSVGQLCSQDGIREVRFDSDGAQVIDECGDVILEAVYNNGVYHMCVDDPNKKNADIAFNVLDNEVGGSSSSKPIDKKVTEEVELLHKRLGHLSYSTIMNLLKHNAVDGIDVKQGDVEVAHMTECVCEACTLGKGTRARISSERSNKAESALDRVWADLQGPFPESEGGKKYLLLMIDEATRYAWGIGLNHKGDAAKEIMNWHKRVTVEKAKQLKEFRSDKGGEFLSTELKRYYKHEGVHVTFTQEYTPHHRGIVERLGRTTVELMRSMLQQAKCVKSLWLDAGQLAIDIHNKAIVKKGLEKTPHELWSGKKPDLKSMRVFGCDAYCHVPTEKRKKLDDKAEKGMFVGFSNDILGWKVLNIKTMKVTVSRDVVFNENEFTISKEFKQARGESDDEDHRNDEQYYEQLAFDNETRLMIKVSQEEVDQRQQESPSAVKDKRSIKRMHSDKAKEKELSNELQRLSANNTRKSSRVRTPVNYYGKVQPNDIGQAHVVEQGGDDPSSYQEAINSIDASEREEWLKAVKAEEQSLEKHSVFTDVKEGEITKGTPVIDCKLIFKKKKNSAGKVIRYKARAVAKGYCQRYGIDYNETFAPVLQGKSVKLMLALTARFDMECKQFDVITAFLNAKMKEKVYVRLPHGFREAGKIKRLVKALYGTKQAPHEWNGELHGTLVQLGWTRCKSEPCLYHKKSSTGKLMLLGVFVDDIICLYDISDEKEHLQFKSEFTNKYDITDMGDAEHLLGMRIKRDRAARTITLDQSSAVTQLLKDCQMENSRAVSTPEVPQRKIKEEADINETAVPIELPSELTYRSIVGSLNYLAGATRLDLSHVVGVLSQKLNDPSKEDWSMVMRVLRYLKGTVNLGLVFGAGVSEDTKLIGPCFTDADWAGDLKGRKSTSGTIVSVFGSIIFWMSKKQKVVTLSSAESEYMALGATVQEVLWVRSLLKELGFDVSMSSVIMCDNQAAIAIAKNPTHISRSKHIDVKHHFVRDEVEAGSIKVEWISTQHQLADILTKPLGPHVFLRLREEVMTSVQ